ncbi:MAG: 4-hydroxy-3-methylbut-2-enyl diphosphate reductase, partial [Rhodospirillales bacterium]|nr:4-hydroxy-3-methylbut-2-enyl diphosphate reductase [Rhodospirillales bacterium]
MQVLLARPRGFCAGVERAIEIVERALERYGAPVYVRHEIVHNKHVVNSLKDKGAVFVKELDEIPDDAVTIFSAHGVSQNVEDTAKNRNLPYIDATCPLVSKVHKEGQNQNQRGRQIILIGHAGHPEVEGTQGRIPGGVLLISTENDVASLEVIDPDKLAYITQTTLSVDETRDIIEALKLRFPNISGPDVKDICYATQNRQTMARTLAEQVDLLLVIGAKNSSNSNRLCEIGTESNTTSYLIDDASMLDPAWLRDIQSIGITAGASAPEELVEGLVDTIRKYATIELK